jgi:hypothetical protein
MRGIVTIRGARAARPALRNGPVPSPGNLIRRQTMKITNHKNGDRSFRYERVKGEHVHGGDARNKAVATQARCDGGVYDYLAALLVTEERARCFSWGSMGTESQMVLVKALLRALRRFGHAQVLEMRDLNHLFYADPNTDCECRWVWCKECGREPLWKSEDGDTCETCKQAQHS